MAVYEVGSVGSQEYCRSLQIFSCAPACCRSLGDNELIERMSGSIGLSLAKRSGLRSSDVAGSNAVALDVVLTVLGADVSGQHLEAALSCRVSGYGLSAQLTHHRADVDDLAVALLDHARNNSLGHDERSVQVDVDNSTEISCGHLAHRDPLDDACVVDKDVNAAEFLLDIGDHSLDFIFLCYVCHIA